MPTSRFAFLLCGLLVCASTSLNAQQIEAVDPAQGTLGTVLSISGAGFGTQRPRVWLTFPAGDSAEADKAACKLVSWSDTLIQAEIVKARVGPCTLHVKPRHADEVTVAFAITAPQATAVSPASATPGATVQISGAYFGTKSVKVTLLDQRARVLSVSDSALTIEVPKKGLPNGSFTPFIANAAGSAWAVASLTVTGSSAAWPADSVTACVAGERFLAQAGDISALFLQGSKLLFDAFQTGSVEGWLSVLVPYDKLTTTVPALLSDGSSGSEPIFFQVTQLDQNSTVSGLWTAAPGVQPWSVRITAKDGNHVAGVFDATLVLASGDGPATISVKDGRFVVTP